MYEWFAPRMAALQLQEKAPCGLHFARRTSEMDMISVIGLQSAADGCLHNLLCHPWGTQRTISTLFSASRAMNEPRARSKAD